MTHWINEVFAPIKRLLPAPAANIVRSTVTAALTPFVHYYRSGHFRSSFAMRAVDRHGRPLPWYTYPCIEFLRRRSFSGRHVLEFGAGQSTRWWAGVAASVIAFDADEAWFNEVRRVAPANAVLHFVDARDAQAAIAEIRHRLADHPVKQFDIVVIDGMHRSALIELSISLLTPDGAVICDNSEGYGFYEGFRGKQLRRVDFCGAAPGVLFTQCTSIFFPDRCFLFDNAQPIAMQS